MLDFLRIYYDNEVKDFIYNKKNNVNGSASNNYIKTICPQDFIPPQKKQTNNSTESTSDELGISFDSRFKELIESKNIEKDRELSKENDRD